jgi:tetratricopeptide (TPR) repeat protein
MTTFIRTSRVVLLTSLSFIAGGASGSQSARLPSESASRLQEAAKEISAGQLQQAEKSLQFVLSSSPREFRALDLLGVVRALQHNDSGAEVLFSKVVKVKPDFAPGRAHLGLLYLRMNREQDAVPELRESLRLDSGRKDAADALVQILRGQAQIAVKQGNLDNALTFLIEARKYAPDDPDVLNEFGVAALKRSLIDDAIEAFQRTLKISQNDSIAVFYLGYAWMDQAKFENARQEFARYVELRPDDPSGYGALGMALSGLGSFEQARAQFERSIALDSKQGESYYQLGLLDLDAGDYDTALQHLKSSLNLKPNDALTLAALGRVDFERKQFAEAITFLQLATNQDSSLQEAHYYLGLALARIGRKSESDAELGIAAGLEEERKKRGRRLLRLREPSDKSPIAK